MSDDAGTMGAEVTRERLLADLKALAADEYVHEHPWTAVGIAAGIGLVLGLLIGRR